MLQNSFEVEDNIMAYFFNATYFCKFSSNNSSSYIAILVPLWLQLVHMLWMGHVQAFWLQFILQT